MRAAGLTTVRIGEFSWGLIEPAPGRFRWGWLDEAVEVLAAAGLQVVLGTPTAAPPAWLTHRHPEVLPVGPDGRRRQPGSRRHCCVSHPLYVEFAGGIVRAMGDRLGRHPAVVGWQVDNELGCHDTARCACEACAARFRAWLQARHGTLEALNEAWGTAFWSQRYAAWEEVLPPVGLVYEALRARGLDVDVLPPTADFSRYEVVVAGSPYVVDDALLARLEAYEGTLILGPRSGFKDGHNRVRPHALRQLTGARVLELDAAEPPWGLDFGGVHVPVETLFERLETQAEVLARYPDGSPGVTRRGRVYYVGAVGRELADHVIGLIFGERTLPEGVELARRGAVTFVLNHGKQPIKLGELALPPLGVAVLRD